MSLVATLTRIDAGAGDLDGLQTPHAGGIPSLVYRWGVIDEGIRCSAAHLQASWSPGWVQSSASDAPASINERERLSALAWTGTGQPPRVVLAALTLSAPRA